VENKKGRSKKIKPETVSNPEKEILKLQNKILKLEIKVLKLEKEKFALKSENLLLKNRAGVIEIRGLYDKHNEPPIK
jgi:hypothetical protein